MKQQEINWDRLYKKHIPSIKIPYKKIVTYLRKYKAKNILDVGCGFGRLTNELNNKGFEATGIDINKNLIKTAKKNSKGKFIHKNFFRFNPKKKFDAIITVALLNLMNIKQRKKIVNNCKRLLSENGLLIIIDFERTLNYYLRYIKHFIKSRKDFGTFRTSLGFNSHHLSKKEIKRLLKNYELELIEEKTCKTITGKKINYLITISRRITNVTHKTR